MAKTKKSKSASLTLINESRQRRDVIVEGPNGPRSVTVLRGKSVSIKRNEVSEQLESMLRYPAIFGLRLVQATIEADGDKEGEE